jgi:non-homologous end joining protein Ku
VLAQALRQRRQGALGRLVLSCRRRLALLRPAGRLLLLDLLHYPAQLRGRVALEAELRPGAVGEAEAPWPGSCSTPTPGRSAGPTTGTTRPSTWPR